MRIIMYIIRNTLNPPSPIRNLDFNLNISHPTYSYSVFTFKQKIYYFLLFYTFFICTKDNNLQLAFVKNKRPMLFYARLVQPNNLTSKLNYILWL